ncbi:hypothetical protein FACS1894158_09390 [Betaproteobacteria bacterium]|nr:hypothetical protein FACS1894158_09390 [Betaproteobacteria bacterium]
MMGVRFDCVGWMLLLVVLLGWRRWPVLFLLIVPLPVGDGVSLFGMLRGLFGGLSVTTVVLLLALTAQKTKEIPVFAGQETKWLPALIALTALLFYPPALGLGLLDPYVWGYDEALVLPLLVGALALAAWLANWRASALALVLALTLWRLRLLESANLWDYLLDPLLAFAALGMLAARGIKRMRRMRLPHTKEIPESSVPGNDKR